MAKNKAALKRLWEIKPHICHWCKRKLFYREGDQSRRNRFSTATVDHLLPREYGGGNDMPEHSVLSCQWCNQLRGAAGHCIGALACARTVIPYVDNPGIVERWLFPRGRTGLGKPKKRGDKPITWTDGPMPSALAIALSGVFSQTQAIEQGEATCPNLTKPA